MGGEVHLHLNYMIGGGGAEHLCFSVEIDILNVYYFYVFCYMLVIVCCLSVFLLLVGG